MAERPAYETPAMTPEQYAYDQMAPNLGPSASGRAIPTFTDVATVGPLEILSMMAQRFPFLNPVGNMWDRRRQLSEHIGMQMDEAAKHYDEVPPFRGQEPEAEPQQFEHSMAPQTEKFTNFLNEAGKNANLGALLEAAPEGQVEDRRGEPQMGLLESMGREFIAERLARNPFDPFSSAHGRLPLAPPMGGIQDELGYGAIGR